MRQVQGKALDNGGGLFGALPVSAWDLSSAMRPQEARGSSEMNRMEELDRLIEGGYKSDREYRSLNALAKLLEHRPNRRTWSRRTSKYVKIARRQIYLEETGRAG